MNFNEIYLELIKVKDDKEAVKMSAYMRDQFAYLGVPTPKRKAACKEHYKLAKKYETVDWEFVNQCWENEYRELQYVAMDYLLIVQKLLKPEDIDKIKKIA